MTSIDQALTTLLPKMRDILAIPTLEIQLSATWAANQKSSRLLLRQAVVAELDKHEKLSEIERETLLRLEFLPDPPNASVSISHTPNLGGFAFTRSHLPSVGFDLEEVQRVHTKAAARVSKPQELSQAPSPAHLWVAKEAAFKAIRGRPKVLSNLTAREWRSVATQENLSLWSCEVHEDSPSDGIMVGLTVELSGTVVGLFIWPGKDLST